MPDFDVYLSCSIIFLALFAVLMSIFLKKNLNDMLVDSIEDILPQTQCGRCGYAGCRPYAEAISSGEDINRCPPGGNKVIIDLSILLGKPFKTLDSRRGEHGLPKVAFIDESACIGCFKCIDACPVDAIIGAPKHMHTVISSACTGCDLCIDPCPVDCIRLLSRDESYTLTSKCSESKDINRDKIDWSSTQKRARQQIQIHKIRRAGDYKNIQSRKSKRFLSGTDMLKSIRASRKKK